MERISITIDGKKYAAYPFQTILRVAQDKGISIPTLCHHTDVHKTAGCGMCKVLDVKNRQFINACNTLVSPGMVIATKNKAVLATRKKALEEIWSRHRVVCSTCTHNGNCHLKQLVREFKVRVPTLKPTTPQIIPFGKALQFDVDKCVGCNVCVEVCQHQVSYLTMEYHDGRLVAMPSQDPQKNCIYCGQCLIHCPVGAFTGVGEFTESLSVFEQPKDKVIVAMIAPSIRTSIGEHFGLPPGKIVTPKLVGALKKLGVHHVLDVSFGADFTTVEEAKELQERLEHGGVLPMFTSCCPSWVQYIEFYHPELIPNLTTVRPPQMILAHLIKTYWAKERGLDPRSIVTISIMPCVAKKEEVSREVYREEGYPLVDHVITTRELAYVLQKKGITLTNCKPASMLNPFGKATGAGVIFGSCGGVSESTIRTCYALMTGNNLPNPEVYQTRGFKHFKEATLHINNRSIHIAAVHGIDNFELLLKKIQSKKVHYDYVEIMACEGGCIGGGGQPVRATVQGRRKRADGLYVIDSKMPVRFAHDNLILQKVYKNYLNSNASIKKICHTTYTKKHKRKSTTAIP